MNCLICNRADSAEIIPLTERQKRMIENPARVVHIGCGTKTGKTVGLAAWVIQGLLAGEACAWVGPWFQRARAGFDTIKGLLGPLIASGEVQVTEGVLRARHRPSGSSIDFYSGDNPQALFGANYQRVVIDEASRCPEGIYAAALTTISATNGRLRCSFNVELGAKNWAIRNLLRVQAMSPQDRASSSEDFLMFPTGGDGLVAPEVIEMMRSQMPEQLWEALYLGKIPESDTSLFRNLDKIFVGCELEGPLPGHHYVGGIDLGRKQDYTVVTIMDSETGAAVAMDRFHEVSWTMQCQRAAALFKTFRCDKVYVDATGLGDPVSEELSKLGLPVEPFIFSAPSRKSLIEELILACDNAEISLPATEKFSVYRVEMEFFEYVLDGSTIRYAAPANCHDDTVMSLALAVHGFKLSAQGTLGVLGWLKGIMQGIFSPEGGSKALPAAAGAESAVETPRIQPIDWSKRFLFDFEAKMLGLDPARHAHPVWTELPPAPCPSCGSACVVRISGFEKCNQCGSQRWPAGPREAQVVTRKDFLSGRIKSRSFKGRF